MFSWDSKKTVQCTSYSIIRSHLCVERRSLSQQTQIAQGKVINVQPGFLGWFLTKTNPGIEQIALKTILGLSVQYDLIQASLYACA